MSDGRRDGVREGEEMGVGGREGREGGKGEGAGRKTG